MAKPHPFPHHYRVQLADRQLLAPPRDPIAAGPPPEFGGSDRDWSPEELLLGATLECLWTTFEAYAKHDTLAVSSWRGSGEGVLEKGPQGPTFTSITLAVELTVAAGDEERARKLLETSEKACIISRALRTPVTVVPTIRTA